MQWTDSCDSVKLVQNILQYTTFDLVVVVNVILGWFGVLVSISSEWVTEWASERTHSISEKDLAKCLHVPLLKVNFCLLDMYIFHWVTKREISTWVERNCFANVFPSTRIGRFANDKIWQNYPNWLGQFWLLVCHMPQHLMRDVSLTRWAPCPVCHLPTRIDLSIETYLSLSTVKFFTH